MWTVKHLGPGLVCLEKDAFDTAIKSMFKTNSKKHMFLFFNKRFCRFFLFLSDCTMPHQRDAVWDCFTEVIVNGVIRAKCKFCNIETVFGVFAPATKLIDCILDFVTVLVS